MADFDVKEYAGELVEKFKKMPMGAKIGIVGVGAVAWYLLTPRTEAVKTVNDVTSLGTLGEGYSPSSGGGGYSEGNYSGGGNAYSGSSPTDGAIVNDYVNTPKQADGLSVKYDQAISTISSQQNMIDEVTANADALSAQMAIVQLDLDFTKALADVPSIYFDNKNDTEQYASVISQVSSNVRSGTFTPAQGAKALSTIAGTGNNGTGWKDGDNAKITATLSNATNKAAESARVDAVIKNREAQGLSTTLQKEHKARFGL